MLQLHCEGRQTRSRKESERAVQVGEREDQGIWSGNEVRSDPIRSGIGSFALFAAN
jgi:hypothetical protein